MKTFTLFLFVLATIAPAAEVPAPHTRISLRDGRWFINNHLTNPGSTAEGLLMNVRMVNATFEDGGKPEFDAGINTDRFISHLDDYAAHGVNAFTLCLQGGMPGYEGAVNSAFEADGSLNGPYMKRIERVIRACDQRGLAVVLGLFYQRQSAILKDDAAVRAGVVNAVNWVREQGFGNVLIEVANEFPHKGFAHELIRKPGGMASLIRLAKETGPGLLVSASGYGDGLIHKDVAAAADFLLPHWNSTRVEDILARIATLKTFRKPIVCNEDDKTGAQAVAAMQASITNGAGYGLMLKEHNQTFPFHFDGAADDTLYYATLKAATTRKEGQVSTSHSGIAFKGRIAYSADGNHNDPDDWISSPVALAIIAESGLKDQLAHFDYNCILPQTDPAWEKIHAESVLGTIERYGYDRARFFDCRKELDRTVEDIARAINESSAENPLWFILAGPMEVPYLGIQKADPAKRQFVYCISHSSWNDGYSKKYTYTHTKRSVIEQDVNWVQVHDQKALSTSPYGREARPDEWQPFHWMRDSEDARVRWLWERMQVSTRPDCSDAGMAWFAVTGDEGCNPAKLQRLLDKHQPEAPTVRKQLRLEAENFRQLEGFEVEYRNDKKASQTLQVALTKGERGRIATPFHEPFAPEAGTCAVDVRYMDEAGKRGQFSLLVNGRAQGDVWESPGEGKGWSTHTVSNVAIHAGDEIAVTAEGAASRLDYVQLNFSGGSAGAAVSPVAQRLRVAVVQMFLRPTLLENRDRIIAGMRQAAEKGARVAVFPERALSGSGGDRQNLVDQAVQMIRDAARERKINVVFGANTWLASVKKEANWMMAIGPDGRDLMRYEKLYDNHRAVMPGVFMVDGVPCSTMICADRWLRGVVELPIQEGAQISFELSNNYACEWVPEYGWYWNVPLARRNTVWSIVANSGNEAPGVAAATQKMNHGHSAIIAPDGHILAAADGDAETIVVADIDTSKATRAGALARAANPALGPFWEAGLKLHRGAAVEPVVFKPMKSKETDITLAAASVTGDLAQIEARIRDAHARKADLVAFPAQAFEEESLERLRTAAKENQITVVAGAKHREGASLRNSAFVIGPDGEVLTRYDQLSTEAPYQAGTDAKAMWFRVKGMAAFVTIGRDALWSELSELAAVAGARVHIHLDCDTEDNAAANQQRMATWANCATFATFTATVNTNGAMLWDDLHGREESRAVVKGSTAPDPGVVEVCPPFSANLIVHSSGGELVSAFRHVPALNPHHPERTANLNPQMKQWYEIGAALITPK